MLCAQWLKSVAKFINSLEPTTLCRNDFNAKTEATYNASRLLNGKSTIVISECGHDPKGRMGHFGYNGCHPMTDEELEAEKKLVEGEHLSQD